MSEELLRIFKPPWRIVRDSESGHYRIHDAGEKVLCWIYAREPESNDYHLPSDREARLLAQTRAVVEVRRPRALLLKKSPAGLSVTAWPAHGPEIIRQLHRDSARKATQ